MWIFRELLQAPMTLRTGPQDRVGCVWLRGKPSRWALECKEHAGKRVGGPRDGTPPAQPLRGFLKIIPGKMSSPFSLLKFHKVSFWGLVSNVGFSSVLGFNVPGKFPVLQESEHADGHHPGWFGLGQLHSAPCWQDYPLTAFMKCYVCLEMNLHI